MKRKMLYRYLREDGGVTVSPVKPSGTAYTKRYRLFAEEGQAITNGEIVTTVIDVETWAGWHDCELTEELKTETNDEGIQ